MLQVPGFEITEELDTKNSVIVYRGIKIESDQNIVLKLLKTEYPKPEEIQAFEREYDISQSLKHIDGVCSYLDIIDVLQTKAIVMADCEGISLKKILSDPSHNFSFEEKLNIAIRIAEILQSIHAENIIHKDICPANILVHPETLDVHIIDFSIASRFQREVQDFVSPNQLEGSLAYISPEQTGRMNRSVDYRSDFYSLGCVLFELFFGKRPFNSTEPMELVHCHLARNPVVPDHFSADFSETLVAIIMKLMEKTAERRYQSSAGLIYDINKCLASFLETGKIASFSIAEKDISDIFHLSEKLYGRDKILERLLTHFGNTVSGGKEVLFFYGPSGIGKSFLINEIHKPVLERNGYFASGKYDQFRRDIPYSAFVQAFKKLFTRILSEDKTVLEEWAKVILEAVSGNGQVLIRLFPLLEYIIGPQPEVVELPPKESQNRFNRIFLNFVKAISSMEHPLVLFLDDLQWIDGASAHLLEILLSDNQLRHFLFIGSYRDDEVESSPMLKKLLEKQNGPLAEVNYIEMTPLDKKDLMELLGDSLGDVKNIESFNRFVELILKITGGNPFFVKEFMMSLYRDSFIYFREGWKWDYETIRKTKLTENIVEMITAQIQNLHPATLEILKVACCIGSGFELDILSDLSGKDVSECSDLLSGAFSSGMIYNTENRIYFVHDKVRETLYSLMSQQEKEKNHYSIGMTLWKGGNEVLENERLFMILSQLNVISSVLDSKEKKQLAELNILAARKSKASTAFSSARNYYSAAFDLDQTSKTFDLELELAQIEYILGNYLESKAIVDKWLSGTTDVLKKVRLIKVKLNCLTAENKADEAIPLALNAAELLGVTLPADPSPEDMLPLFGRVQDMLKGKKKEDVLSLPVTTKEEIVELGHLFVSVNALIYFYKPALFPHLPLNIIELTFENGLFETSSFGFAMYSAILTSMGDFYGARDAGELACALSFRFNNPGMRSFSKFLSSASLPTFCKPDEVRENYKEALQLSLDAGDTEYGSYSLFYIPILSLAAGSPIPEVKRVIKKYKPILESFHQATTSLYFSAYEQFCVNVLEKTEDVEHFTGSFFNEEQHFVKETNKDMNLLFHYSYPKVLLNYLMGKSGNSLEMITTIEENELTFAAQVYNIAEKLLFALSYSSLFESSDQSFRNVVLERLRHYVDYFTLIMSNNADLHRNKRALIAAELSRISDMPVSLPVYNDGDVLEQEFSAIQLYELSITWAERNGFLHEEAIACERAAEFYLSQGANIAASTYMTKARYCYEKWGCKPKVLQLDREYPELLASVHLAKETKKSISGTISIEDNTISFSSSSGSSSSGTYLDLGTVMKASYALAREIGMSALLGKMIQILVENAGAGKGFLILPDRDGQLVIQAELESDEPQVFQNVPIDRSERLSSAIVRYVASSKERIILDNASDSRDFAGDRYIVKNRPLSLLCLPILNQDILMAVLYMENNLVAGAFSPERVELLNLLSTQAAISIKNAQILEENRILFEKQQQAMDQVGKSLAEKETLLKELYHRTKNNMQMILSMLYLSGTSYSGNVQVQQLVRETENRIHSMALVHQKLFESHDLSQIDLRDYILDLIPIILSGYPETAERITVDYRLETLQGLIDTAVPLGIILNELMTNTLKHAFPAGRNGTVSIGLRREDKDHIRLQFSDDGQGVPEPFDIRTQKGIGLQTVIEIVENQLHGDIQVKTESGFSIRILLEDTLYSKRV